MAYGDIRTGYLVFPRSGAGTAQSPDRFIFGDQVSTAPVSFTESTALSTGTVGGATGTFYQGPNGEVYFVPTSGTLGANPTVTNYNGGNAIPTIYGSATGDNLSGTAGSEVIYGGARPAAGTTGVTDPTGNDTINAGDGNDTIYAGDGNDNVAGGAGNDLIYAGTGNDTVRGGAGNDTMFGGAGSDILSFDGSATGIQANMGTATASGEGTDVFYDFEGVTGSGSADTIWGGRGGDTLIGNGGADFLSGRAGDDLIFGGAGVDTIYGGAGNDTVFGGADGDILFGRSGQDVIVGGAGADSVNGGEGNDLIYGEGTENDPTAEADGAADTLRGGNGMDTIYGGGGNDSLVGGGMADTIFGGTGNDTILGDGFTGTAPTAQQTVNWGNFNTSGTTNPTPVANGGSLATAASNTVGPTDVTLEYTNTSTGGNSTGRSNFQYDADTSQWNGSSAAAAPAARLYRSGQGSADFMAVNFATNNDAYQSTVRDVSFRVNDIDANAGQFSDQVIVRAFNGEGQEIDVTITFNGVTTTGRGNVINGTGDANGITAASAAGSALINVAGPVSRIEISYANGVPNGSAAQAVWVTNMTYTTIAATAGDDSLVGGAGADSIDGQDGNDTIIGGDDNDSLDGADTLLGGAGNDSIRGGSGADIISGGDGDDTLIGGLDTDTFDGNDSISGGAGNDILSGGAGNDTLLGGTGNDTMTGGIGNDSMDGGTGSDTFVLGDNFGADTIIGGEDTGNTDIDVLDGSGVTQNMTVTWTGAEAGRVGVTGAAAGTFSQIERVTTGSGNDNVDASSAGTGGVNVATNGGNDTIVGSAGADTIDGGAGNDTISGGAGADSIIGGIGNDSLDGGAGNDTLLGGEGNDTLTGGTGNDSMTGGTGSDRFVLGNDFGTDTIVGGEDTGNTDIDVLDGSGVTQNMTVIWTGAEAGRVGFTGSTTPAGNFSQIEQVTTGSGDDTVNASSAGPNGVNLATNGGNDTVIGSAGADTIDGGAGNDSINGGAGADSIIGGIGNDSLEGGDGNDTLNGGEGNDTLIGGAGADVLNGGAGADRIVFGRGDTATGGTGNDTFVLDDLLDNADGPDALISIAGGPQDEGGADVLDLSSATGWRNYRSADTEGAGFVLLSDGSRVNYTGIESVTCFTPGAMIRTLGGERAIETLGIGDMVLTRDNGLQPIRWIGTTTVAGTGRFAPVRVRAGMFEELTSDLLVSPQHRFLLRGHRAELMFGQNEVLAAARHLEDGKLVTTEEMSEVTYIHLMFDRHEILHANGMATESFHPGSYGLSGMCGAAREELFALFPDLRALPDSYGPSARRVLRAFEARALAA